MSAASESHPIIAAARIFASDLLREYAGRNGEAKHSARSSHNTPCDNALLPHAREIKRPRNARAELPKWRWRRIWNASILPRLGAHTPFSKSPQYRSCIASNSGQGHVP